MQLKVRNATGERLDIWWGHDLHFHPVHEGLLAPDSERVLHVSDDSEHAADFADGERICVAGKPEIGPQVVAEVTINPQTKVCCLSVHRSKS